MSPLERELADALRALCPPAVHVGARLLDDARLADLLPVERKAIKGAGPARRREFATGRALLRDLMPGIGAVGVLPSRAPDLPHGVRASLAHDAEVAVAVVALAADGIGALGVDVERYPILSAAEVDVVRRSDEAHLDAGLVFVLKEAVYKAWASGGGDLLEFTEVRLNVGDTTFCADVRDGTRRLAGRHTSVNGRWVAVVVDPSTA